MMMMMMMMEMTGNVSMPGEENEADEQTSLMPDVVNRYARRLMDVSSSGAHQI